MPQAPSCGDKLASCVSRCLCNSASRSTPYSSVLPSFRCAQFELDYQWGPMSHRCSCKEHTLLWWGREDFATILKISLHSKASSFRSRPPPFFLCFMVYAMCLLVCMKCSRNWSLCILPVMKHCHSRRALIMVLEQMKRDLIESLLCVGRREGGYKQED